jgi:hypothetical protein
MLIGNKRQIQPYDSFLIVKGQIVGVEISGVCTGNPTYWARCVLNSAGNVTSLVGPMGDTISVGGGGLTNGGKTGADITGAMNGSNDTYTLPGSPAGGFAIIFFNVQPLVKGVDYTLNGAVLVFATIRPNTANNDSITAFY